LGSKWLGDDDCGSLRCSDNLHDWNIVFMDSLRGYLYLPENNYWMQPRCLRKGDLPQQVGKVLSQTQTNRAFYRLPESLNRVCMIAHMYLAGI